MNPFCRVFPWPLCQEASGAVSRKGVVPQDSSPERFCRRCSEWTQPEGPSGPTPVRSLGAVLPGPRPPLPSALCPRPHPPRLGLSPSWVPLCPRGPFSARAPALPPCPQGPLVVEEKQGTDVPSGSGPSYPSYPLLSAGSKHGRPGGPALLSLFWNLPALLPCPRVSCDHAQKQGGSSHWARPKVGFRGRRAEGASGQRMWLSVTTRNIDSHRESAV